MAGLVGDFEKLKALVKNTRAMASRGFRRDLNKALATEALFLVSDSFDRGVDPHGRPWRSTYRGGSILRDTGRLANSFRVHFTAAGFTIGTNVKYAATHNYGATIKAKRGPYLRFRVGNRWVTKKQVVIPKRQFIPDSQRLGSIWRGAFAAIVNDAVRRRMLKR